MKFIDGKKLTGRRVEVMFEFLMFGILIGIAEDLLAIKLATGEPITWRIVGIIIIIAIPFAVLGEIVADRVNFLKIYKRVFKKTE